VYQGLDWEGSKQAFDYYRVDTIYFDGHNFPFPDESFEYVLHTEVLEHIQDPQQFLDECCRVLQPRGELFFSVPFQARYHYIPNDYWRFTPAGLELLLLRAGFTCWKIFPRGSDITVAVAKCMALEYRWLRGNLWNKLLGLFYFPLFPFFLLAGHISLRFKQGSTDDTLGYNIVAIR
jgi:2-polyprenyl-3-methyl-5-hydroxy-6-metoxy-1,4-benzoquinol methylase